MEQKEILIDLEELSALMMDSINGFKQLAERVENEDQKQFFIQSGKESTDLWNEINKEIEKNDGSIKTKGTVKGAINHLWMKVKVDIIHTNLNNVLDNIEICEKFNINRYEQVMKNDLPQNIHSMVERHHNVLTTRLQKIDLLRVKCDLNNSKI
jgi:uncharacterized protein (TIGR02284 family)